MYKYAIFRSLKTLFPPSLPYNTGVFHVLCSMFLFAFCDRQHEMCRPPVRASCWPLLPPVWSLWPYDMATASISWVRPLLVFFIITTYGAFVFPLFYGPINILFYFYFVMPKVFHLQVPHDVAAGGKVEGTIAVTRQKENVRLVSVASHFCVCILVLEVFVRTRWRNNERVCICVCAWLAFWCVEMCVCTCMMMFSMQFSYSFTGPDLLLQWRFQFSFRASCQSYPWPVFYVIG